MLSSGYFLISRSFSTRRRIQFPSLVQANARIKGLIQQGHYQEALESYAQEPIFPSQTSKFTFPSLLKACACLSNFNYGATLQSIIIKMGLLHDPYITNSLVSMHVKCGLIHTALQLFDEMSQCEGLQQDVAVWNSIINGLVRNGYSEESVVLFRRMQGLSIKPDGYTLSILLGVLNTGYVKDIHGYALRNAFHDDPFVITAMIDVYGGSGRPLYAWNVFRKLEDKSNIAIWNAMISGFCENGYWRESVELYVEAKKEGLEFGSTTFSSTLKACSQGEFLECGSQLHCDVFKAGLESDLYVRTSLLTFYSKLGFVEHGERIFFSAVNKEVEIWNSMISAYVNSGCASDALNMYQKMRLGDMAPNSFTISNTLVACSMMGLFDFGKIIHGELIKRPMRDSVSAWSALLTMYLKHGSARDANKVFGEIKEKDIVAWGSMISGSCENKNFDEALEMYKAMESDGVKPDPDIIASVVMACTGVGDAKLGSCMHGLAIKKGLGSDAFVGTALIEFYSKCGEPERAKGAFLSVLHKNLVVWNSLISAYSQNSLPNMSISLLPEMQHHGLTPDCISLTSVLSAVSQLAALLKGKVIHCYYIRQQILDVQVNNALIDMYIKCGCFTYAELVFQNVLERNLVAWNSMIGGYGSHGECRKAIEMFHEMRTHGTTPDDITFLHLISACNHCGFVDDGLNIFQSMREHGIKPKMAHYVNIVDLLGRSGCLDEAYSFIKNMEIEPDRGVWLSLLSACRVHRHVELGELAADNLLKMDPTRGSNYTQLLNLYVEAGLQEKAAYLRGVMKEKGLTKVPGCSWIEVKDKVDVFFSGDSSSPETVSIYDTLDSIKTIMQKNNCDYEVVCEPG